MINTNVIIKSITKSNTAGGLLARAAIVAYALFFVSVIGVSLHLDDDIYIWYIIGFAVVVTVVYAIKELLILSALKRRTADIAAYKASAGLQDADTSNGFKRMSISNKQGVRNQRYTNMMSVSGCEYADFSYDIYRKTKHGEYKAMTIYYSVMAVKLPRRLPNVLFDSLKARKRQFRMQFDSSQQHSLEGDFDNFFTTYFPNYYHVDSLSFITPEVMEALIAASDYDIEIKDDYLYIFGDLRSPSFQINDMTTKITAIKTKLLHNIVTYRDERLPYEQGRAGVTAFASSLLINLTYKYIGCAVGLCVAVVAIALSVWQKKLFGEPILYGCIVAASCAIPIRKELKKRKQDIATMQAIADYNQEKKV